MGVAQSDEGPTITRLDRYDDGSCGGVLTDADGATPFHLAFTAYRADLWCGVTWSGEGAGELLPPGSDAEAALLARLAKWSERAFDAEERAAIEAAPDVHHRGSGWTFDRYKAAAVVNRLAHFRRIRGARITDVFQGRGTVRVSFKMKDGLGNAQLVLFRNVTDAWSRPHLADSVEPVAIDSVTERFIVQAMTSYAEANIEKRLVDLVWSGAEIGLGNVAAPVRDVLFALVNYRTATSPRLIAVQRLRDGGSVNVVFVDPKGDRFDVFFDGALGSATKGRIKVAKGGSEDAELIGFGSVDEVLLLAALDGYLKRNAADLEADGYMPVKVIAERLAAYRKIKAAAGK